MIQWPFIMPECSRMRIPAVTKIRSRNLLSPIFVNTREHYLVNIQDPEHDKRQLPSGRELPLPDFPMNNNILSYEAQDARVGLAPTRKTELFDLAYHHWIHFYEYEYPSNIILS